jgi:hypothetical protein
MSTTRFRLRSLIVFVALAAIGSWIASTAWRYWNAVSALQDTPSPNLVPFYVALVLSVVVALSLIVIGIVGLAIRLRTLYRATSPGQGRTRPEL